MNGDIGFKSTAEGHRQVPQKDETVAYPKDDHRLVSSFRLYLLISLLLAGPTSVMLKGPEGLVRFTLEALAYGLGGTDFIAAVAMRTLIDINDRSFVFHMDGF